MMGRAPNQEIMVIALADTTRTLTVNWKKNKDDVNASTSFGDFLTGYLIVQPHYYTVDVGSFIFPNLAFQISVRRESLCILHFC
jgi:hypothetical protein